jgi:D-beta-D-heptose 7-phosphate kinase/D-beta-D-heptose 1-phosphate adenosyltransferase
MFNIEDALKLVSEQTVLCVGDLMLDEFVYGEVSRISPEAPASVLAVTCAGAEGSRAARSQERGGYGNDRRCIHLYP